RCHHGGAGRASLGHPEGRDPPTLSHLDPVPPAPGPAAERLAPAPRHLPAVESRHGGEEPPGRPALPAVAGEIARGVKRHAPVEGSPRRGAAGPPPAPRSAPSDRRRPRSRPNRARRSPPPARAAGPRGRAPSLPAPPGPPPTRSLARGSPRARAPPSTRSRPPRPTRAG